MKKSLIFILSSLIALNASQIKLDTTYSGLLGNPFKKILDEKTESINLSQSTSKIIDMKVDSNLKSSFMNTQEENFSIDTNHCNNVLKNFLSEKYNFSSQSNKSISCEIVKAEVYIDYFEDDHNTNHHLINNIEVDTTIHLTLIDNNKTIIDENFNKKMDRNVEMNGSNYSFTIVANGDFSGETLNQSIQKIIEYSIYDILNNQVKGN